MVYELSLHICEYTMTRKPFIDLYLSNQHVHLFPSILLASSLLIFLHRFVSSSSFWVLNPIKIHKYIEKCKYEYNRTLITIPLFTSGPFNIIESVSLVATPAIRIEKKRKRSDIKRISANKLVLLVRDRHWKCT